VYAAPPEWNEVLQLILYLTIFCSVGGDELGESFLTGFGDRVGARDLDGACTGVSFPADVRWLPVLLVLWSSVGGWSDGGSDVGVGVGESVAPSGGGPWRIKFLLIVSGGICVEGDWYLVMVEEAVVHSLGVLIIGGFGGTGDVLIESFLCVGASIRHGILVAGSADALTSLIGLEANDDATGGQRSLFSLQGGDDGDLVRLIYQHKKSGWFSTSIASDGYLPTARGGSSSDVPGLLVIEALDPLQSGDVNWPIRSAIVKHVGVPDVLRREGGRLHERQLRPSATGTTRRNLQRLSCYLFYFHSSLCKLWNVNYHKFI
jgi:hypothetical protein